VNPLAACARRGTRAVEGGHHHRDWGLGSPIAAKRATSTIPIVLAITNDPVAEGVVSSLARPGGNITGLSSMGPEVVGKQLELLKEVVPKISRVAALGLQLHVLQAGSPSEIDAAFAALRSERTNAVLVLRDTLFLAQRTQIAALATKRWLPVVSGFREEAEAGGPMAYGASVPFQYRGAAT
jgi:putative tryptophan/tyrosine transport system substrate-binding protein